MAYDQTLIPIRERSWLDLLDLALIVVRRWPLTLFLAALAGIAPCAALNYWIGTLPEFEDVAFEQLVLPWIEAPLATAPLTIVLGGLIFGDRATVRGVAKTLWSRLFVLLMHQGFLRIFCMFIYPIIPARMQFLNEVILLERGPAREVGGRRAALCGAQSVEFFIQWLGQFWFGALFVFCFWAGTGAIENALVSDSLTWDRPDWAGVAGVRVLVGLWLTIAYFAVVRFLTYIDQRTRLEGWEVELRLKAVGRAQEEARTW